MPLTLRSLMIGLMLLMIPTVWADNSILKPPANSAKGVRGGKEYCIGTVYLSSHQDTIALKPFGFLDLKFIGRSLGSVKYEAMWPVSLDVDSLPDGVSGLDYELSEPDFTASTALAAEDQQQAIRKEAIDRSRELSPYRRAVVRDFRDYDKYDEYYTTLPMQKRVKLDDDEDINLTTKGNFHVIPVDKGSLRRKESVGKKDDPNLGTFRVLPVEEGNYHTKEHFFENEDPNLGTFRVNPVESGRYHKPQNVGSGKPSALGTFRIMPDPKSSSLRPTDFGIIKKYSTFQTGQSFFVTPQGGIQDWQRVGSGSRPRTVSWQEWQRQHRR